MTELTKTQVMATNTMNLYLPLWTQNFRENYWTVINSPDILKLPPIQGPALCVGAGPSLSKQLQRIRRFKGTIFACEKSLVPLLKRGVIPHYLVILDGTKKLLPYLSDPIVDEYADRITAICATTANAALIKRWTGKTVFFNAWLDDPQGEKSVSLIFHTLSGKAVLQTGGHVGAAMWFLALQLGADPIVLLGIDMAYPASLPDLSKTQIWDAIRHLSREEILSFYRRETNSFGKQVITDYMWDGLLETWITWIAAARAKTIQCSELSILHAPPIECMPFEHYLTTQNEV